MYWNVGAGLAPAQYWKATRQTKDKLKSALRGQGQASTK